MVPVHGKSKNLASYLTCCRRFRILILMKRQKMQKFHKKGKKILKKVVHSSPS